MYHQLPLQDPPKVTQIVIFGLKICRLAALVGKRNYGNPEMRCKWS
jgi:hypothetical protein